MKRRILFTLFSLLMSVASFSQVQKNFFGATLGVSDFNTTYWEMYNYFGKEPNNIVGILSYGNITFAGYHWDAVNAHFHNGKFAQVNLRYHLNYKATTQQLVDRFNSLSKALSAKYGGSKGTFKQIPKGHGQSGFYHSDGRYMVSLAMDYTYDKNNKVVATEVQMWYWDSILLKQPEHSRHPIINDEL